jgi:hypothetical protein
MDVRPLLDQNIVVMKRIVFFLILLIPTASFSQNFTKKEIKRFKKVLKRSNSMIRDFDKEALISIERIGNAEIEGLIENALFMSGFEVVSNKVAKDAVSISNKINDRTQDIEVSRSTTYKAVYVITVSGNYYNGAVLGHCQQAILSFSARIVDLQQEGKLVGTFKFSGNAMTYVACEEDVANAFAYKLLQLAENK